MANEQFPEKNVLHIHTILLPNIEILAIKEWFGIKSKKYSPKTGAARHRRKQLAFWGVTGNVDMTYSY
jgi:hypothetical protein